MQPKWTWFDRKFDFSFPPEKIFDILERLRGTPIRASQLVSGLAQDVLTRAESDDTWSVQENIAHLADLEPLWMNRVNDILSGAEVMREADLTNTNTTQAQHNARTIDDVLRDVTEIRESFINLLTPLTIEQFAMASLHPRLNQPMRVVDLCFFAAEHDDYHLARARYLIDLA